MILWKIWNSDHNFPAWSKYVLVENNVLWVDLLGAES